MPEMIRDGKGRGNLTGVDSDNRLMTTAVAIPHRSHVSAVHAESYSIATDLLTLSAADTWHWVLWYKNTSSTKNLYVDSIIISWDGGSTNYNRPLFLKNVIPAAGQPTVNETAFAPSQNNKNSNNVAAALSYKWDGVGAGMTDATGPSGGGTAHSQGHYIIPFYGSVITGLNEHVGLSVKSPEVGIFSVGVSFYFLDKIADA